jgi:hypothetical protein
MSNEAATTAVDTTIAPTKAEQRLAEQKAKREQKEAEKAKRKAANAAKRANGIIGTLHQALLTERGTTKKEILATLIEKFPDRDPIGMATTVGIQLSRLQKKHGKIVSRKQDPRGLVYGYEKSVRFAPEVSEGTPAPDHGATPVAAPAQAEPPVAKPQGKKGNKKR